MGLYWLYYLCLSFFVCICGCVRRYRWRTRGFSYQILKITPAQLLRCGGCGFYLSQSFLFISGFLLQPPSCVFEHFLHFPDLFSDFDIFHPFVNVCFVMSGRKNNIVWGAISQYACFPKKSICNFIECTLISMALFGV